MTDALTHAVTVPQPLAWAVAAGHCHVIMSATRPGMEREWKLIGIHASCEPIRRGWIHQMPDLAPALRSILGFDRLTPADCPLGALIGVARLVGVVRVATSNSEGDWALVRMRGRSVCERLQPDLVSQVRPWWRFGTCYGLLLEDAVLLPEPIPMRGAGGVWRLPFDRAAPEEGGPADWALEQWRMARAP